MIHPTMHSSALRARPLGVAGNTNCLRHCISVSSFSLDHVVLGPVAWQVAANGKSNQRPDRTTSVPSAGQCSAGSVGSSISRNTRKQGRKGNRVTVEENKRTQFRGSVKAFDEVVVQAGSTQDAFPKARKAHEGQVAEEQVKELERGAPKVCVAESTRPGAGKGDHPACNVPGKLLNWLWGLDLSRCGPGKLSEWLCFQNQSS